MQVSPLSNTTIAVTRGVPSGSGSPARAIGGLAIYDNGTQRPQVVAHLPLRQAMRCSTRCSGALTATRYMPPTTRMPAATYIVLPVTATGVTLPAGNDHAGIFNIPNLYIHLNTASGWLYGDDGTIVDPVTAAGKGNTLANGVMTPDPLPSPGTGYGYYVAHPSADPNVLEYFVLSLRPDLACSGAVTRSLPGAGNSAASHSLEQLERRHAGAGVHDAEIQLSLLAVQRGRWKALHRRSAVAVMPRGGRWFQRD